MILLAAKLFATSCTGCMYEYLIKHSLHVYPMVDAVWAGFCMRGTKLHYLCSAHIWRCEYYLEALHPLWVAL